MDPVVMSAASSAGPSLPDTVSRPSIGVPATQPSDSSTNKEGSTLWSIWTSFVAWIGTARSMALLGGSASAAAVASAGAGLLLWLYVTRTFAPASAHIIKPLYFDYTQLQAVAATSLVSDSRLTAYAHNLMEANPKRNTTRQLVRGHRFLAPGEVVSMWVNLRMPRSTAVPNDLFQAVGEVRSADGRLLARSSRPTFPLSASLLSFGWNLWALPLRTLGLWSTDVQLQVVLFERYVEQNEYPFVIFHCTLHGRAGGGLPPPVASADLHVRLHIGPLRRILYWVRPGWLLTVCLAIGGLCACACGSCSAALLFALWLWSISVGDGSDDASSPNGSPLTDGNLSSGDEDSDQPSGELSESNDSSGWVKDMGGSNQQEPLPLCDPAKISDPDRRDRISSPADQDGSVVASTSGVDIALPSGIAAAPNVGLSSPKRRR